LTTFGTLISDIWSAATRTLTAFGFTVTTSNAADVTAIKVVTDKMDTGLVQDGSVWQFTVNMLELGPVGSGATAQQVWEYATRGLTEAVELDSAATDLIQKAVDGTGYLLAINAGAVSDPRQATSTYVLTAFGATYTSELQGQTEEGVRTAPTLSKA
jgi:hypothetical protein